MKLNIPGQIIIPVLIYRNAPEYKLINVILKKINNAIILRKPLHNKDSITLANEVIKININRNYGVVTFDIENLYFNISIREPI